VLPGSLDNPKAIGCLNLLHHGAQVVLGENHLLEMLGTIPQLQPVAPPTQTQLPLDLEPDLQTILQTLTDLAQTQSSGSTPLDLIVEKSGLAVGSASSALLQLELMGLVTQLPGMRYQRS
jgi:DNA processing protein